jgi:branched-subunit amino acid transport protein
LQGSYDWSLANGRVIAALCAAFVAWKFKNVLLTMSVGMATLFAIQALFSA